MKKKFYSFGSVLALNRENRVKEKIVKKSSINLTFFWQLFKKRFTHFSEHFFANQMQNSFGNSFSIPKRFWFEPKFFTNILYFIYYIYLETCIIRNVLQRVKGNRISSLTSIAVHLLKRKETVICIENKSEKTVFSSGLLICFLPVIASNCQ